MEFDDAIGKVSHLYRAVTGHEMPISDTPYAPIPAERDPVQHVHEQMDRLIGLLSPQTPRGAAQMQWSPPIAIYESTSEVVVAIDVPGTSRDRVAVHVESGALVVSGKRAPAPANGETLRLAEVRFGEFRRVVPLPVGLRTAEMSARLDGGVLEVRIPRDGANGVRQVSVA
jgi:HSP20 family protein